MSYRFSPYLQLTRIFYLKCAFAICSQAILFHNLWLYNEIALYFNSDKSHFFSLCSHNINIVDKKYYYIKIFLIVGTRLWKRAWIYMEIFQIFIVWFENVIQLVSNIFARFAYEEARMNVKFRFFGIYCSNWGLFEEYFGFDLFV